MVIANNCWSRKIEWSEQGLMSSAEPFSEGEGDTAVLLVHGFNNVPYIWKRISRKLVDAGYATSAIRLPGSGERNGTATFKETQDAVMREYLLLKAKHKEVFIVSHSFGGAMTIDLLNTIHHSQNTDNPLPKPAGAVLLAPLIKVSSAKSPVLSAEAWYRVVRFILPAMPYTPSSFNEYLTAEDDPSFKYRRERYVHISRYKALFNSTHQIEEVDPAKLETPLMVFIAGDDKVVDSDATRKFFSGYPNKDNVIELDGASHTIPLLSSWESVTDRTIKFIKENSKLTIHSSSSR